MEEANLKYNLSQNNIKVILNESFELFGFKLSLEVLILMGIIYLVIIVCRFEKKNENVSRHLSSS